MKTKKMADQQASHENSRINDNSQNAQNARLAGRMEQGSIDTFAIMRELNICRPGARICDLRNAGYEIITNRIVLTDEWGRTHRGVAVYTLIAKPGVRAAA
ncbi:MULTISPECIES: helix-turn-helix domain-containing protein [unclassified Pseudomonas]|uniref:helix-turn-helix domain-containing protein n=1 Tax=unclassified Pseudomonas TaxID=196821 RepID=UPI002B23B7BB|nr:MULTISPECIES: helix-turn-helix domain-containing protein [unclassified Pseudomonas]MEA9979313.1 helix-turn-helix domain-containing protein [Pseudomonas sp. RTS4]MEB0197902.1 helix-turn-helix domain-containing protein [Pseudomonas sp. 5S4]MEB0246412.1 helix-turn-helix domain-containing protein [Pseudomonas sp. 10S5]